MTERRFSPPQIVAQRLNKAFLALALVLLGHSCPLSDISIVADSDERTAKQGVPEKEPNRVSQTFDDVLTI
ncbi:MAG: hypothetical protein JO105_06825 [Hyphomicrobiales bacterium]|nr:hypothetical protein [Hyphomicrobiales bacterium]